METRDYPGPAKRRRGKVVALTCVRNIGPKTLAMHQLVLPKCRLSGGNGMVWLYSAPLLAKDWGNSSGIDQIHQFREAHRIQVVLADSPRSRLSTNA